MGNESGCLHAADFFVDANYCAFITLSALQGCRAAPLTTCCRLVPPCPPLPRVPPPVLLLPPRPPPRLVEFVFALPEGYFICLRRLLANG